MTKTTATKKNEPVPAKALAEKPHKGLNEIQEELTELFADVLLNGGARSDVDLLLEALDRHSYRRRINNIYGPSRMREIEEALRKQFNKELDLEYWYRSLSKTWPESKAATKTAENGSSAAKTVAEVVRADIQNGLREKFDEFMARLKDIESAWLLNEILEYATGGDYDLAQSFAVVLHQDASYIRVPDDFAGRAMEFVALLQKEAA